LGRLREFENGPRTIDIDILLYANEVINSENLVVPHPRMHQRNFVLVPLQEIAYNVVHPVIGKRIGELYTTCTDSSQVTKLF
jgi:2-amino-4-hydroxy-6-hydroxymethyldihydropteridine diphosphokinase